MANRHGLITGATGTGKTVSLQILAEGFSSAGRSGLCRRRQRRSVGYRPQGRAQGFSPRTRPQDRLERLRLRSLPVIFWDFSQEQGHPVRTTMTEMGPVLLSRLMGLSEAQEGALNIAFKLADEEGLAILDLKDLRALLSDLAEPRQRHPHRLRQCRRRHRRHHTAPPRRAGRAGSGGLLRRAGARDRGFHAHDTRWAGLTSTFSPPTG